jgi:hypothetical protein
MPNLSPHSQDCFHVALLNFGISLKYQCIKAIAQGKAMLVSHKHKFIYIKTRKTASTSIEGLLEPLCAPEGHVPRHVQPFIASENGIIAGRAGGEKETDPLTSHSSARAISKELGTKTFRAYLKVYPVRNPYDKVVSWFWHVMPPETRGELQEDFGAARKLFRTWLLMRPILPVDSQFYTTSRGFFKAHTIHYERMSEDLEALAEKLKAEIDMSQLPSWKTASRAHKDVPISDYYDTDTSDIVKNEFSRDFKKFGYRP